MRDLELKVIDIRGQGERKVKEFAEGVLSKLEQEVRRIKGTQSTFEAQTNQNIKVASD